ncbi:unnamed protein product [Mycena citricolor]|uniref:Uncharacterized protein n=1 Tax=Mycena citricolor TaxID=2018698 RepID=A0AAD2K5R2_9AGAR|nr:unnamed protein product [Mycena citricolor]
MPAKRPTIRIVYARPLALDESLSKVTPFPARSEPSITHACEWTATRSEVSLPECAALSPLRKHDLYDWAERGDEIASSEPSTMRRMSTKRRRREPPLVSLGWRIVLPGALYTLLSASSATGTLLYLMLRGTHGEENVFYLKEDGSRASLRLLLWTTIMSNVVSFVGCPLLIGLAAYWLAAASVKFQQQPDTNAPDESHLMTPLQYGLLLKLFASPSPRSVLEVAGYLQHRRTRVGAPGFFAQGALLVGGILSIGHLLSLTDIWLHVTSYTVSVPLTQQLYACYPFIPTLAYIVLLYLHSGLALGLTFVVAMLRSPPVSSGSDDEALAETVVYPGPRLPTLVELTHLHLTDPLASVAARLSGRRTQPSTSGRALFVEDVNTARVMFGFWEQETGRLIDGKRKSRWGDASHDRVFGVYKEIVPWKGEIY